MQRMSIHHNIILFLMIVILYGRKITRSHEFNITGEIEIF